MHIQHDATSSDTSQKTTQYAAEVKPIKLIPKSQIHAKSPDVSSMDFNRFRLLKQKLHLRGATILAGVWKIQKQEWNMISIADVQKVMKSWKCRQRLVVQEYGEHIEQTKQIHRPKLKF